MTPSGRMHPPNRLRLLAGIAAALTLLTAGRIEARPLIASACTLATGEHGVVAAVLSAFEVKLAGGLVVRLAGLEAPSGPVATAAEQTLRELAVGQEVDLRYAGTRRDRYGRALAHVHLTSAESPSLQRQLVARGLARVAATPDGGACLDPLIAAENEARQAGRGLWSDPAHAVKWHGEPSLRHGNQLYELVEGRVLSTGRTRRAVYLNFGRDWSSDFTVIIPASLAERLEVEGVAWDALASRRIRVRGWLEQRDGPMITVTGPWQIEVLDD